MECNAIKLYNFIQVKLMDIILKTTIYNRNSTKTLHRIQFKLSLGWSLLTVAFDFQPSLAGFVAEAPKVSFDVLPGFASSFASFGP
jgi:hypothetical protein